MNGKESPILPQTQLSPSGLHLNPHICMVFTGLKLPSFGTCLFSFLLSAVWSPRISPTGLCVPVPHQAASRGSFSFAYSFFGFVLFSRAASSVPDPRECYWPLLIQPSSSFPKIQSLCTLELGGVVSKAQVGHQCWLADSSLSFLLPWTSSNPLC